MSYDPYIVKPGDTITDIVLNATGNLVNWDAILEANGIADWTPDIAPGMAVMIPDSVTMDTNILHDMRAYPVSNFSTSGIAGQIQGIFDILENNWILETGVWNDDAIWIDTKNWEDA